MGEKIDIKNAQDTNELKEVANILKNGGIVVFPTETVYGIGVNGLDENAIKKLYKVKQRSLDKPISLLVSNMEMIEKVAKDITDIEYKIMEKFFPGPLTIILKKQDCVPDILTANQEYVGIRMPSGEQARMLVEYAGVPLATSSANISNKPSGTNIKSIIDDFKGKVDCFIDGGESDLGIASTIVKVVNNVPYILREGSISKEKIENVCKNNM